MFNYTLNKDNTNAKIKSTAKAELTTLFLDFLSEKFGTENVAIIRTGNSSKTNEIGFRIGTVDVNGEAAELIATINPTIKEFEDHKTAKKEYVAFDFAAAVNEYNDYVEEKELKAIAAKKAKEEKIARDTARRKAEDTAE